MATKALPINELIMTHLPKNYKYYIQLKDESMFATLEELKFDIELLDTIRQPELIKIALDASYKYYDREVVAHAKEPTMMENGVILSKKMATKTDKKLSQVGLSFFTHNDVSYVAVKLCYEQFDIYEIFILT